eukprot:CAMPEP_0197028952 /NCGR_PEP_ID=MMETSP1384-20130603/8519_1 /TAXON_ID=29189 /ORGANISM="Ammonia sp." /LENGTH=807 /DNA_ID=CAMNT_0042458035 /DNA_START=14 /DNA_END=2437 /DNA_ORIENTATION=+
MGNDIPKCSSSNSSKAAKQSKKWLRSKAKKSASSKCEHKREDDLSLDLVATHPPRTDTDISITSPSPRPVPISFNCHHKLQQIDCKLKQLRATLDEMTTQTPSNSAKTKSLTDLMTPDSCKKASDLLSELDAISNDIECTIHGITHNYLDGIVNERALLDYWSNIMSLADDSKSDEHADYEGVTVIVFEIGCMDQIHQRLGWQSGDNIIMETGSKIEEYCDWYSSDFCVKFKLFHPDFAVNEYVVITTCMDEQTIFDFCECVILDVARSVKCFFQETIIWAGYHTDCISATAHSEYDFRGWYEKAKCAIKEGMKLCPYAVSDDKTDRIRKWLSPKQRLKRGVTVLDLVNAYYHQHGQKAADDMDDIYELIESIEEEMKHGADLNYADNLGNTSIFYALLIANRDLIQFLFTFEFDADHRNNLGETALVFAIKHKVSETICCTLAKRLKFPNIPDHANITPFVWALNNEYYKVMEILTDKGCMDYKSWIVSSCMKDQEIILCDIVRDNHIMFHSRLDSIGRSILHYCVLHRAYNIIRTLLNRQYINVDIADYNGWSPLHYAAAKGYTKVIALLVRFNANIFLKTEENYTPTMIAFKFKQKETVLLLQDYEHERKTQSPYHQHSLSLSKESSSGKESSSKCGPIKISLSARTATHQPRVHSVSDDNSDDNSDDEDGDDSASRSKYAEYVQDWNKENEDMNVIDLSKEPQTRNHADSQSKTQSSSENQPKSAKYRKRACNVSVIDECHRTKPWDYDYDDSSTETSGGYSDASETDESDSNQTRIIHRSWSDKIEQALINLNKASPVDIGL